MFNSNAMNELKHLAADRYQRAGGGGAFTVYETSAAYHKARGYNEMSAFRQAAYRASVEFKSICEQARSDFAFARVAFDLAKEEKREARNYALATIPF
jgi:hypothetical protein